MKIHHTLRQFLSCGARAATLTLMAGAFLPTLQAAELNISAESTADDVAQAGWMEVTYPALNGATILTNNESASNNTLTFMGDVTVLTDSIASGASSSTTEVDVSGNTMSISDANLKVKVYGALLCGSEEAIASGSVSGNTVEVENTTLSALYGTYSRYSAGDVYNNTLTMNTVQASSYSSGVYHRNSTGNVYNNTFKVTGSEDSPSTFTSYLDGIYVSGCTGHVHDNKVELSNTSVSKNLTGVTFRSGSLGVVYNNEMTLTNSTTREAAYTVYFDASTGTGSADTGSVYNNTLTVTGGSHTTLSAVHINNCTDNIAANGNTLTMDGGTATTLYGTYFKNSTGSVSGSRITISGNATIGNAIAAYVYTEKKYAGCSASLSNNSLTVKGSTVTGDAVGAYFNKHATGSAANNAVTLDDKSTASSVYGACTNQSATYKVDFEGNSATVQGNSTVTNDVYGAYTSNGSATNNTAAIDSSTVSRNVYGGYAGKDGEANSNSIVLSNATVTGDIYGGYATGNGRAEENIITLRGNGGDLSRASIYGSNKSNNNELNLVGFQGAVLGVQNVDSMGITLADWDPSQPVLQVLGDNSSLTNVAVTVKMHSIAATAALPQAGEEIHLFSGVDNTEGMTVTFEDTTGVQYGMSTIFDFTVEENGDGSFSFSNVETHANPQTKALSEGRVAAMALTNQASDLAAEQGVQQAARGAEGEKGIATFFATNGGHTKVDSGSHVDVDGVSAMLGASAGMLKQKALTLGGFIESGWSKYTTHNSFADAPAVRGTGESSYCGGGVLLRYEPAVATFRRLKGLVLDASLRAGRQAADFSSADLTDGNGQYAAYDLDSPYLAGHVGASYSFTPTEKVTAVAYARYLWSHLGSESVDVCGEKVDFDSVNSNRLRFGVRASWQATSHWQPYAGLAYEWECSGTARATSNGTGLPEPSMRGGRIMGEIGTSWQPNLQRALWWDAGLHASAGKSQGYSANIGCTVAF